ncbi:MAG: secondary thiamine-phosphate synthase enzyme YjbQ [Candidatus Hydrothermia bacterium]|jgi:secondary thiamine-phosphate synthase enzyme|nr:secondary thiamine-phosphate synthase enzyme YjbQ [Candidatus Hydrothermia bacterium]
MIKLNIKTTSNVEIIDITEDVKSVVNKLNKKDGIILIYVPHTTAAITINESYDPNVGNDIMEILNIIAPRDFNYKHIEGNASAHIKASLIGSSVMLILENGEIKMGKWQGILFFEFDGPRNREIWIKVI